MEKEAYGVDETAVLLSTSDWTIKKLIRTGQLDSFMANGRRLIPRSAIAEMIARGIAANKERLAAS
jgi:excisionase family DNA binding protein